MALFALLLLLLLLLLLFNFQFYFQFLTILHLVFTQGLRKVVIICILCICFLLPVLGNIFGHIDRKL